MRTAAVRAALWGALFMPLIVCLGSVATAFALVRGGQLVFTGVLGLGTLAAFVSYTTQLFDPIQQMCIRESSTGDDTVRTCGSF